MFVNWDYDIIEEYRPLQTKIHNLKQTQAPAIFSFNWSILSEERLRSFTSLKIPVPVKTAFKYINGL